MSKPNVLLVAKIDTNSQSDSQQNPQPNLPPDSQLETKTDAAPPPQPTRLTAAEIVTLRRELERGQYQGIALIGTCDSTGAQSEDGEYHRYIVPGLMIMLPDSLSSEEDPDPVLPKYKLYKQNQFVEYDFTKENLGKVTEILDREKISVEKQREKEKEKEKEIKMREELQKSKELVSKEFDELCVLVTENKYGYFKKYTLEKGCSAFECDNRIIIINPEARSLRIIDMGNLRDIMEFTPKILEKVKSKMQADELAKVAEEKKNQNSKPSASETPNTTISGKKNWWQPFKKVIEAAQSKSK